ncbi:MAG: RagB/SusD family nutrient uptake outer membrane protein [Salinivirgaceae bacterium]|jgi:hypothetical protein|nr:RagB/SusD family nutrient uptake outer membrane protein [Salinivirgaceae bacterium]
MKSKIIISIIVAATLTMSCTKLDETTYSVISTSEYGTTPEELTTISGGAYATMRGGDEGENYWVSGEFVFFLNEVSSDEATIPWRKGNNWGDEGVYMHIQKHELSSDNKVIWAAWLYCFRGITACNLAISPIEASDMPEGDKLTAKAELRGIRAYYYYNALTWFGNIPINKSFPVNDSVLQSPKNEVYAFLEQELVDIIPFLQEQPIYGRITQDIARGLLARLYINSENLGGETRWQECLDVCSEISTTSFPLNSTGDYFSMFASDNTGNPEIMFAIPFDFSSAGISGNYIFANTMHYNNSPAFSGYNGGGNNGICAQPGLYSSFDPTDIRRESLLIGPQISIRTGEVIAAVGGQGNGAPLIYTEEVDSAFMAPGEALGVAGARLFKYKPTEGQTYQADHDFVVMRYAEIIMMQAECLVRLNRVSEAEPYLNQIRQRAGLNSIALGGLSTEDQLKALDTEWKHEFVFEGLRRDVNIRFGDYLKAWWEKGDDPSDKYTLLFPIPRREMENNPKLVQNPGY